MSATSTAQEYENIEAISVGMGVTYSMNLSEKSAESCPDKYSIFKAIRTWENARSANAFPRWVKKELSDASQYFHLAEVDANNWDLYKVNSDGSNRQLFAKLERDEDY